MFLSTMCGRHLLGWVAPAFSTLPLKHVVLGGSFVRQELFGKTCLKCHKCQSLLDSEEYYGTEERRDVGRDELSKMGCTGLCFYRVGDSDVSEIDR